MKTINLTQGSNEWHEHRSKHYNASDAPAMMGVCKYRKRDDLIAQRATGVTVEVDSFTQRIFDKGHEFEALARPMAEKQIGEGLSPVTGVDGIYSSSFDGITFDETIIFEHKTLNENIAACISIDDLHKSYKVQMEHQLMVSGANKCLFMASKWDDQNGLIDSVNFWYKPDLKLREAILNGWKQFAIDVENYKPEPAAEIVIADPVADLPLPMVVAKGELVKSNITDITPRFDIYLQNVNTQLSTDQHFADAKENAKQCRSMAKKLRGVADNVISQMASVAEVDSVLREYESKMDAMGLRLEKLVKTETESIKKTAIMAAQEAYTEHCIKLNDAEAMGGVDLMRPALDFAAAIKGVRTVESMQSRINDLLASGKAELTGTAKELEAKLAFVKTAIKGHAHLFNVQDLVSNDIEHIKLIIKDRIANENNRIEKAAAEKVAAAEKIAADAELEKQQAIEKAAEAEQLNTQRIADEKAAADQKVIDDKKFAEREAEIIKQQAEYRESMKLQTRDALIEQLVPFCKSRLQAAKLADAIVNDQIPGVAMNYLTAKNEAAA